MSLDLLAAFDDIAQSNQDSKALNNARQTTSPATLDLIQQTTEVENEEEFGDFEDADTSSSAIQNQPGAKDTSKEASARPAAQIPAVTKAASSGQHDQARKNGYTVAVQAPEPDARIGRHPFADRMDMLFAADEDEYSAGQDEWHDLSNNPEAAVAFSKRVIQEQLEAEARENVNKAQSTERQSRDIPASKVIPEQMIKPRNLDVLFDADDLSETEQETNNDDAGDWGDFESSKSTDQPATSSHDYKNDGQLPSSRADKAGSKSKAAQPQAVSAAFDLLGLDDAAHVGEGPASIEVSSPTGPSQKLEARQTIARSAASFNAIIENGFTDAAWDDFEDSVPVTTTIANVEPAQKFDTAASSLNLPKLPPANVPPPSILLSTFADLLKQPLSQKIVLERLAAANVLAHVIAGRKLRWKRSSTLAASMRIGPAAIGGKGGMKLTGLDRSEAAKEDREVAEVLTVWRAQLGRLRSVCSTYIGSASAADRSVTAKVPEVQDPAPIKALKAQEGALIAPHECALCGLRRQERIAHVDDHVDDSFGEWWTEGADMHTACAAWWVMHEALLRSR